MKPQPETTVGRVYPRKGQPDTEVWVDAFAGKPAPTGLRGLESGVGIDEPPEHFVGSLGHLGTQFDLGLAQGQLHGAGCQVHLLAAVYPAQPLGLKVAGLAGSGTLDRGIGDLAGGLIDQFWPL